MISVPATSSSAIAILQMAKSDPLAKAEEFFSSGIFTTSSPEISKQIAAIFSGNTALRDSFEARVGEVLEKHPTAGGASAGHIATYETIMRNRGSFPPESFVIQR